MECDICALNKYKYFLEITIRNENPNVISKRLWPHYDAPLNLNWPECRDTPTAALVFEMRKLPPFFIRRNFFWRDFLKGTAEASSSGEQNPELSAFLYNWHTYVVFSCSNLTQPLRSPINYWYVFVIMIHNHLHFVISIFLDYDN